MTYHPILVAVMMVAVAACNGCNSSPGRPKSDSEIIPPSQVMEFSLLYSQNCAGCLVRTEGVERRSLWPIPFFLRSLTIARFAALPQAECPAHRCRRLRRVRVGCSPTNRSTL